MTPAKSHSVCTILIFPEIPYPRRGCFRVLEICVSWKSFLTIIKLNNFHWQFGFRWCLLMSHTQWVLMSFSAIDKVDCFNTCNGTIDGIHIERTLIPQGMPLFCRSFVLAFPLNFSIELRKTNNWVTFSRRHLPCLAMVYRLPSHAISCICGLFHTNLPTGSPPSLVVILTNHSTRTYHFGRVITLIGENSAKKWIDPDTWWH